MTLYVLCLTALDSLLTSRSLSLATKLINLPDSPESALVTVFSRTCYKTVQVTHFSLLELICQIIAAVPG